MGGLWARFKYTCCKESGACSGGTEIHGFPKLTEGLKVGSPRVESVE